MKKLSLFLKIILIFVLLQSLVGCGSNSATGNVTTDAQTIKDAAYDFAVQDSYSLDPISVDEWSSKEAETILEAYEEELPLEVYFIRANIVFSEGNYDQAEELFRKCIGYRYDKDNVDLMAKSYYELAKLELKKGDKESAKELIAKIDAFYYGSGNRNVQIYIYSLWAYDILETPGGIEDSIDIVKYAVTLGEDHGFVNMAYIYYEMAYVYSYSDGNAGYVSEYNLKALEVAREADDVYWIATVSADIGANYHIEGYYNKAMEYMLLAYERLQAANEENDYLYINLEIYVSDIIVQIALDMDDIETAEKYLNISGNLLEKQEEGKMKSDNIIKHYATMANMAIYKRNYDEALSYIDNAYESYKQEDFFYFTNFEVLCDELYGMIYEGMGDAQKALKYYEKAVNEYELVGGVYTDPDVMVSLYKISETLDDKERMSKYANRMTGIIEELSDGKNRNSSMLVEEFESAERENQIELLKYKNQSLNHIIGSSVMLLGIAIYFGIVALRKNRQIRQLNEKLYESSLKDELTKLNNRRSLNEYLDNNWSNICTNYYAVSVVMIDIDYFKKYNDYYGHLAGDQVLTDISTLLSNNFSKDSFVARYGGEEFLIIMPNTTKQVAVERMNDLQAQVAGLSIEHAKSQVADRITLSVGIASTEEEINYLEMIHYADNALYIAKRTRNTIISTDCTEGM